MSTKNYSRASYHLAETKSISSPSLQKKVTIVKTKESPTARFAESGFEQSSHYNRTIKELQSVIDKAEAKKFSTSSFHYSPSQYEEEIICEPSTKDIVVHVPRTVVAPMTQTPQLIVPMVYPEKKEKKKKKKIVEVSSNIEEEKIRKEILEMEGLIRQLNDKKEINNKNIFSDLIRRIIHKFQRRKKKFEIYQLEMEANMTKLQIKSAEFTKNSENQLKIIVNLENKVSDMERDKEDQDDELKDERKKVISLSAQNSEYKLIIAHLEKEINMIKNPAIKFENHNESLLEENRKLTFRNAKLEAESESLKNEIERLREEVKRREEEAKEEVKRIRRKVEELLNEIADLKSRLADEKRKNSDLEKENKTLYDFKRESETIIREKKFEITTLQREIEFLKSRPPEIIREHLPPPPSLPQEVIERKVEVMVDNPQLLEELGAFEKRCMFLDSELLNLRREYDLTFEENGGLKRKVFELENMFQTNEMRIREEGLIWKERVGNLTGQLKEMERINIEKNAEISRHINALADRNAFLEQMLARRM